MTALALLSLLIWLGLLFGRGGFWKADQLLPAAEAPAAWPSVAVIVPARNEASTIREVIEAHGRSDYPGDLRIFICDDHSDDGTAAEALSAGGDRPVTIVEVPDLPAGWSGKLWALDAGARKAREAMPEAELLLFTDADIVSGPTLLRKLVAHAEKRNLALTSIMARLDDRGFWGGLLVPAFIFFFQKLYPFPLINRPSSGVAGAAGGVVLLRREALDAIGGLKAMRGALIDDCALARRVKATGRPVGLYLFSDFSPATSLRDNRSYEAMQQMVARTAYTQLGYNPALLIGTLIGLGVTYLAGPLAFAYGLIFDDFGARVFGLLSWLAMTYAYAPTLRRFGRPWWHGLALPLAALFYGWFTWLSAWRHWQGKGGQWKGRSYPASKPS